MRSSRWLVVVAGMAFVTASFVLLPADASAQRRVVRRPAGPVVHVSARPYRPVYYRPFSRPFSRPFYSYGGYAGWYGGWYNYYGWPPYHVYGQPFPYGGYYRGYIGEARLQVQPRHAQVFIDGYFVGTVDDFDGWAQRLRVEPGEHELEIFLEGHRTFRQQVLFRPGATLRIEHVMQPLGPGEQPDTRPTPSQGAVQPPVRGGDPDPAPRREPSGPSGAEDSQKYGAIAIRVQPADAEVLVNGERWESPEAGDLTLQLSPGTHRVEVRKEGFRAYAADIGVRRGETTTLNVSLSRAGR